jgi:hypothetical protein
MIFRRFLLFMLMAISDMALANPSRDQALHSLNEKWDANQLKPGLGLA